MSKIGTLDRDRIRELFDLRSASNEITGGFYREDPYPIWHRLREEGPVLEGTMHELTGLERPAFFMGLPEPDVRHFTVFDFEHTDAGFRNDRQLASWKEVLGPQRMGGTPSIEKTLLCMWGEDHRRYRTLVQPSFAPAKMRWWMENWTEEVIAFLIDNILAEGRADLNVDFCAAIPLLTITGSFGISVDEALDLRDAIKMDSEGSGSGEYLAILSPVVEARREEPQDDLLSVLVEAELTEPDGSVHRLTDDEIHSFAYLLLVAGSGTTWKQLGITLAALLTRPEMLDAVRADRSLLKKVIEESLRWMPTDPMFGRWAIEDTEMAGVSIPAGSVVHLGVGPANRDPARWERPDEFDPDRKLVPGVGFGSGPHTCLGQHVARAEMTSAINALLDRLPGLRLDPDAEPPAYVGFYERGATEIPVVIDR